MVAFTFQVAKDKKGQEYILCTTCNMKSYSPGDIEHKYCANCDRFHLTGNKRTRPGQTS